MLKQETHTFIGMQQDLDVVKHKAEFLYHAYNIRLTARGANTQFAMTNEKGTSRIKDSLGNPITMKGSYLGHCILGTYIVVFTKGNTKDYIYRIKKENSFSIVELYSGDLNFSKECPIETIGVYENELVQKVYWIDGRNTPRVINIVKDRLSGNGTYNKNTFNFVQYLSLKDNLKIIKNVTSNGIFPAGMVQYAITYYNKYGQESNISQVSPLIGVSHLKRGGSPEDKISNSFTIYIENPDQNFEFVRVYSIVRTSIDATPTVKIVTSVPIKDDSTITVIDNNTTGTIVDPTLLLYIGGEDIIASTFTSKDNTLFLGNIELVRKEIPSDIKKQIRGQSINFSKESDCPYRTLYIDPIDEDFYKYGNTLNATTLQGYADNTATFMCGENYKFGVQFQHASGKWSEPIFINNGINTASPTIKYKEYDIYSNKVCLSVPQASCLLKNFDIVTLKKLGYKKLRGVVSLPTKEERLVVAKGMLCPTVYNVTDRLKNAPYAQSSWFLRPFPGKEEERDTNIKAYFPTAEEVKMGAIAQYKHYTSLFGGGSRAAEIQGVPLELSDVYIGEDGSTFKDLVKVNPAPDVLETKVRIVKGKEVPQGSVAININPNENDDSKYKIINYTDWRNIYGVDQSIVTMYSPDIEFADKLDLSDISNTQLHIIGSINFDSSYGDINITTSSPPIDKQSKGFNHVSLFSKKDNASRSLLSGLFYDDYLVNTYSGEFKKKVLNENNRALYMIYPWHKSGSLNTDIVRPADKGVRTAVLKRKVISNIKFSSNNTYGNTIPVPLSDIKIFNNDQVSMVKLDDKVYYGNIDTMIAPMMNYGSVFSVGSMSVYFDYGNKEYKCTFLAPASFTDKDLMYNTEKGTFSWYPSEDTTSNLINIVFNFSKEILTTKESFRMKYKTTPHVVMALQDTNLEEIYRKYYYGEHPLLLMGSLTRSSTDPLYEDTESSLRNRIWLPAGDAVPLSEEPVEIIFKYGDTYYQRYDCLKTYPFTLEDPNSIVEIGSFMCETRINIDGRYDRNRGLKSNLNISNINFNKINHVYSQKDSFFNYRILEEDFNKINYFTSSVIWSKSKKMASEIDNWTNINIANIMDLDGDRGVVISLNTYKDSIFCFQPQGISNILFNSRVQIPVSDGVPVEIGNSYKVEGKRYVSSVLGCNNKQAIRMTESGIYFIENNSKELYHVGSQGLTSVSATHNMSNVFKKWDYTYDYAKNNLPTQLFYDNNYNDLYIVGTKECLNFSETIGQFVSFFSYENIPAMFNVDEGFYSIINTEDNTQCELWRMFDGEYNNFFGKPKPYDFTFVSNSNEGIDKTFTNLLLRADFYQDGADKVIMDGNTIDIPYKDRLNSKLFFDYVQVYNEYQDTGKVLLTFKNAKPSNLKKKFRLWALDIPRDKNNKLDRIRNNWTYIKLGDNSIQANATDKDKANSSLGYNKHMILHNVTVNFHI